MADERHASGIRAKSALSRRAQRFDAGVRREYNLGFGGRSGD